MNRPIYDLTGGWVATVIAALFLIALAVLFASSCSGTRPAIAAAAPHPWTTDTQAVIATSGRLLADVDALVTHRVSDPQFNQRYAGINAVRGGVRTVLMAAQTAVLAVAQLVREHVDTGLISISACEAMTLVRMSRTALTQLASAFSEAGVTDAPSFADAINGLSVAIDTGPVCRQP